LTPNQDAKIRCPSEKSCIGKDGSSRQMPLESMTRAQISHHREKESMTWAQIFNSKEDEIALLHDFLNCLFKTGLR
jgi:hypothetical protein